ncbi:TetR/AcrR family transcriptional regulator [Rhodococcoides kroppenstedtii]|uniref:TetR/AcrR family transcriptional regulator n=1 Tax=Rhodococcoides kroppenstedtii TaxID=293050 RepID=UPI001BDE14C2|nr:TetR/AcrR family transcriptional regulator [Rhodococcus kroppenstedtii]MBT1193878.1 TetR/AcrR family transcriptional regulator [Rhodococcus kroppenstedtii]
MAKDESGSGRSSSRAESTSEADTRRRLSLDRRTILLEAVRLIDDRGLRELTMRGLGVRLGVEAMTLYHYIPGKEDLLDGVVETVIDELYGDPQVRMSSPVGWQDYLQRLAHGVRRMALAHPQVFPLVATRPPAAPWVRPPLRSLRWMENFIESLLDWGFDDAAAVAAYRAFSSFLLGHLLLEVSAQGVDTGPVEETDPATGQDTETDLSTYPQLMRLEPELSQDHSLAEFEQSLESLLDRLDSIRRR